MSYIGAAAVLFGCVLAIRAYGRFLSREVRLLQGFADFLGQMRAHTTLYLEPVSSWVSEFECAALEEIGFLPELRGGRLPKEVYRGLKIRPSCPEADRLLFDFFDRFGLGSLKQEEAAESACLSELARILERERGEVRRRTRAFGAVLFAILSGVLVLVI